MKQISSKAVAIVWLNDMKEKGRTRLRQLNKKYNDGIVNLQTLKEAEAKLNAIKQLTRILSNCQLSLDELEEIIKGIGPKKNIKI